MKEIITKTYQSFDGEIFDKESSCINHENKVSEGGIYLFGNKISENDFLNKYSRDYYFTNYSPQKMDVFSRLSGGCVGEVYGQIADELGIIYDLWNYNVYQTRNNKPRISNEESFSLLLKKMESCVGNSK